VQRGTVDNTREGFYRFLGSSQSSKAVSEATRNWGLMYGCLEKILDDVALAHPLRIRATTEARIKTDKIDADILADLLCAGLLLKAYVPAINSISDLYVRYK